MVEILRGQDIAVRRNYSGFSIELLILYCLGKQLTSKQASRRDFEANKQASKQRASKSGNQASKGVFCLLACLSASLIGSIVIPSDFASPTILNNRELVVFSLLRLWGLYLALGP